MSEVYDSEIYSISTKPFFKLAIDAKKHNFKNYIHVCHMYMVQKYFPFSFNVFTWCLLNWKPLKCYVSSSFNTYLSPLRKKSILSDPVIPFI